MAIQEDLFIHKTSYEASREASVFLLTDVTCHSMNSVQRSSKIWGDGNSALSKAEISQSNFVLVAATATTPAHYENDSLAKQEQDALPADQKDPALQTIIDEQTYIVGQLNDILNAKDPVSQTSTSLNNILQSDYQDAVSLQDILMFNGILNGNWDTGDNSMSSAQANSLNSANQFLNSKYSEESNTSNMEVSGENSVETQLTNSSDTIAGLYENPNNTFSYINNLITR